MKTVEMYHLDETESRIVAEWLIPHISLAELAAELIFEEGSMRTEAKAVVERVGSRFSSVNYTHGGDWEQGKAYYQPFFPATCDDLLTAAGLVAWFATSQVKAQYWLETGFTNDPQVAQDLATMRQRVVEQLLALNASIRATRLQPVA